MQIHTVSKWRTLYFKIISVCMCVCVKYVYFFTEVAILKKTILSTCKAAQFKYIETFTEFTVA